VPDFAHGEIRVLFSFRLTAVSEYTGGPMDLEEHVGVEEVKERCESCGAKLTSAEIEAALEGTNDAFLCARCASERVSVEEEAEET
jgi:hypothetical protein